MSSRCRTRGPRPARELPSRRRRRFDVTTMPDGSTLSIPLNVITGTRRHPRLLAVAGHHGDEQEGPSALISLWHSLRPESLRGSLVMIPVLNPPAFQALRRASLEDGLDINRIFPGNSRGTVTERLADALCAHLIRGSDLVLSMHGWSAGYLGGALRRVPEIGQGQRGQPAGGPCFRPRLRQPAGGRAGQAPDRRLRDGHSDHRGRDRRPGDVAPGTAGPLARGLAAAPRTHRAPRRAPPAPPPAPRDP